MKIRKKALSIDYPDILISTANLALTYRDQGRWKEAGKLDSQVTEMSSRVLGTV